MILNPRSALLTGRCGEDLTCQYTLYDYHYVALPMTRYTFFKHGTFNLIHLNSNSQNQYVTFYNMYNCIAEF